MINSLPKLNLPRRWENLERQAKDVRVDPLEVVERVDAAASHVDGLLDRVRTGGGLFEVFFGTSGSGKTTFLRSLPKFFNNIKLDVFSESQTLTELPEFIRGKYNENDQRQRIVLIEKRDNPRPDDIAGAKVALASLLDLFRASEGEVVVLWPITDKDAAKEIADACWMIGRDSMTDHQTRGLFEFHGLPKERWPDIADRTSQSLNGDHLNAFGITDDILNDILTESDTISLFFSTATSKASELRDGTWSVLKNKVVPRVWVVVLSDDPVSTYATTTGLTQGSKSKVDVELISEFIDAPGDGTNYIQQWRKRRESVAFFLRNIDLRIFDLPPNVALAAIRRFGDPALKSKLNQQTVPLEAAKNAMKSTRLYKAILEQVNVQTSAFAGVKKANVDTSDEYLRIQQTASNNDKPLNQAVAALLQACLNDDAPNLKVVAEKQSLPHSTLKPDIQIEISDGEFVCIEATWRSSGRQIQGVTSSGQDTSKTGHMKKYVLDKANDFVVGMGLE